MKRKTSFIIELLFAILMCIGILTENTDWIIASGLLLIYNVLDDIRKDRDD